MGRRKNKASTDVSENKEAPEGSIIPRRTFLTTAAAAAGVSLASFLLLRDGNDDGEKRIEANKVVRFMTEFPESLPGASKGHVEKFSVHGAQHCLVHLRDVHSTAYIYMTICFLPYLHFKEYFYL